MQYISIIGSFRKNENYEKIRMCIYFFQEQGYCVLSPAGTDCIAMREKFVLFETDDIKYDNRKIQLDTLGKIFKSDIVYVVNTNGYIGKTTCYEIGRVIEKKIPVYFLEKPIDLPICITSEHIKSPFQLVELVKENNISIVLENCDQCLEKKVCLGK